MQVMVKRVIWQMEKRHAKTSIRGVPIKIQTKLQSKRVPRKHHRNVSVKVNFASRQSALTYTQKPKGYNVPLGS